MQEYGMNMMVKKNIGMTSSPSTASLTVSTPNPEDMFWKVPMLFDRLNATAKKFVCRLQWMRE